MDQPMQRRHTQPERAAAPARRRDCRRRKAPAGSARAPPRQSAADCPITGRPPVDRCHAGQRAGGRTTNYLATKKPSVLDERRAGGRWSARRPILSTILTVLIASELPVMGRPSSPSADSTLSCQQCLPSVVQQTTASSLAPIGQPEGANGSSTTTLAPRAADWADGNATEESARAANRRLAGQSSTVLCNSRCSCVILEPLPPAAPDQPHSTPTPELIGNGSRVEQALIAFNEDYSLDYEAPVSAQTAGNRSDDAELARYPERPAGAPAAANPAEAARAPPAARQPHLQEPPANASLRDLKRPLFPLPHHHHLHHHHHAHQAYLPAAEAAPGAPPVAGQAPYAYHHVRANYLAHLRQLQLAARPAPPVGHQLTQRSLVPLRSLDLAGKLALSNASQPARQPDQPANQQPEPAQVSLEEPRLISALESMLLELERHQIQSLSLRSNELQFELWSELYALLAAPARQHIFHLDLAYNELSKLGATFTGFIEHHLAAYGQWPANATDAKAAKGAKASQRLRHNVFAAGKLFALVQQRLENQTSSSYKHNATSLQLLQQPMLLRALDLSHNKLKWLIKDQFRALKHVQTIRLDYNRIRYIHEHAFSQLQSLRFLNLNFNRLQVIYVEQFQTNYNLLALMLRSNYLAYLRGGSFASLANLKRLDLSHNKLTILSNNAFVGLESLELLNCSSNQFVHAPSASLHPLTSLRKLDLSANLIAQLAPGTFFHLPLEELWLNQNEQLVAIDRGAFWDLPYLRQLHLRSNPMLMSVNSQAFVGTQSLQTIDVADCQALEEAGLQVLENVTLSAASRLLRLEQMSQAEPAGSGLLAPNGSLPLPTWSAKQRQTESESELRNQAQLESSRQLQVNENDVHRILELHTGKLKYAYYLASLAFLAVVLKLVFKYTSTSHYLGARRRRRRRVYQTKSTCEELPSEDYEDPNEVEEDGRSLEAASNVFPLCSQQPGGLLRTHSLRSTDYSPSGSASSCSQSAHSAGSVSALGLEDAESEGANEISVISEAVLHQQPLSCCPECPHEPQPSCCPQSPAELPDQRQQAPLPQSHTHLDMIHSQLVAAGYDYGHGNCAHFYQSLGPALQLADMTANFVSSMDYY